MVERDLEQRLRGYFAAEVGDDSPSSALVERVAAIPDARPTPTLFGDGRLAILLAAAALLLALLVGLTLAVGSGLVPFNAIEPTPMPSLAVAFPTPVSATAHIDIDGLTRDYLVVVPSDWSDRDPLPLLLALHGGNVTTLQAEAISDLDALTISPGAIVVYPDGYQNSWNAGSCCQPASTEAVDDVAFIAALLDRLETDYPIDLNRVFIAGDGTGGSMAYRAACELSDRFAAVAVVSGPLLADCNPAPPIPALHIHGTADTLLPYDGGGAACDGPCPSVDATMERWRQADGCTGGPTDITAGTVVTTIYSTCDGGVEVEFVKAIGVDSTWDSTVPGDREVIWSFLTRHPR